MRNSPCRQLGVDRRHRVGMGQHLQPGRGVVVAGPLVADGASRNDHVSDVEVRHDDPRATAADQLRGPECDRHLEAVDRDRSTDAGIEQQDRLTEVLDDEHGVGAVLELDVEHGLQAGGARLHHVAEPAQDGPLAAPPLDPGSGTGRSPRSGTDRTRGAASALWPATGSGDVCSPGVTSPRRPACGSRRSARPSGSRQLPCASSSALRSFAASRSASVVSTRAMAASTPCSWMNSAHSTSASTISLSGTTATLRPFTNR